MKVLFLADKLRSDQPILFNNLAAAAISCGDSAEVSYERHYDQLAARDKFDAVCCWGWRRAKMYREQKMNVLVAERGYIGDRFKWYSLGWNGLNGRAQFPQGDDSRWCYYWKGCLEPLNAWKSLEGYVLVMGQVPSDTAVRHTNFLAWARTAIVAMRQRGFVAHYRAHPKAPQSRPVGVSPMAGDLATALRGAAVAVTYNSNSGVDAVLAGVPVIACDPGSMVYSVAGNNLQASIVTPDRTEWAHRIAWSQWLIEETALQSTWLKLKSVITKQE